MLIFVGVVVFVLDYYIGLIQILEVRNLLDQILIWLALLKLSDLELSPQLLGRIWRVLPVFKDFVIHLDLGPFLRRRRLLIRDLDSVVIPLTLLHNWFLFGRFAVLLLDEVGSVAFMTCLALCQKVQWPQLNKRGALCVLSIRRCEIGIPQLQVNI